MCLTRRRRSGPLAAAGRRSPSASCSRQAKRAAGLACAFHPLAVNALGGRPALWGRRHPRCCWQWLQIGHGSNPASQAYCNVKTSKSYQLADWRLRPLPRPMVDYARTDARHLLNLKSVLVRDLCVRDLSSLATLSAAVHLRPDQSPPSVGFEPAESPLARAFRQSNKMTLQLYAKPTAAQVVQVNYSRLLARMRRLGPVGPHQAAALRVMAAWRDVLARSADESPSYILPDAAVIHVAAADPARWSTPASLGALLREADRSLCGDPRAEPTHAGATESDLAVDSVSAAAAAMAPEGCAEPSQVTGPPALTHDPGLRWAQRPVALRDLAAQLALVQEEAAAAGGGELQQGGDGTRAAQSWQERKRMGRLRAEQLYCLKGAPYEARAHDRGLGSLHLLTRRTFAELQDAGP